MTPPNIEKRTGAVTQLFGAFQLEPTGDNNRCVPHASTVLNRMNSHGENIGIHYTSAGYTNTDGVSWHAQSIVRLPHYSWDWVLNGQYFVQDIDHPRGGAGDPNSEGHLGVARLDFTGGKSGRLIGSNKTFNDDVAFGADWLVTPNPGDSFVPVWGTPKFHIDEVQNHPGGMSGLGWHVAVSLMQWDYNPFPNFNGYVPVTSVPLVKIFDHWNPENPELRQVFTTWKDPFINPVGVLPWPTGNDAVAVTKLADGRFLMVVEKGGHLSRLEFYVSQGTDLLVPGIFDKPGFAPGTQPPDAIYPASGASPSTYYPSWTTMNFITDCDTQELYLLGFKSGTVENKRVVLNQNGATFSATFAALPNGGVASRALSCADSGGNNQCSFESAAGSYIDPDGKVIFYSTGGDNDGCSWNSSTRLSTCSGTVSSPYLIHGNGDPWWGNYSASTGYIRGMEFHERHGNSAAGSACPTVETGWVELYEHPNFNSGPGDTGKHYYISAADWSSKPMQSLFPNNFNDGARSIRWCLPPDYSFAVTDAVNWAGRWHTFRGMGTVRGVASFSGKPYAHGAGSMDNSISSYFLYDYQIDTLWDAGNSDDSF